MAESGHNDSIPSPTNEDMSETLTESCGTETFDIIYTGPHGLAVGETHGNIEITVTSQRCSILLSCMQGKDISLERLRWVSLRDGHQHSEDKMIILSYVDDSSIKYQFFKGLDEVFQKLASLMKLKFRQQRDAGEACYEQVMYIVEGQPTYMNTMSVSIQDRNSTENKEFVKYMVIIDLECLSVFSRSIQPLHQLMFWKDPGPNSVEQVKLMAKQCIIVYTETEEYTFEADEEFIQIVRRISSKEKDLFTDVEKLFRLTNELQPNASSNRRDGKASEDFRAEQSGELTERNERMFARRRIQYDRARGKQDRQEHEYQNDATVDLLIYELDLAVDAFAGVEDMEINWIATEHDINDTIESGLIPQTEHSSGGLDPNSADHLKRTFGDIEDQFKDNNIPVAISRMRACRELFRSSTIPAVDRLFQRDDMSLMKALYMKSLQS